MPAFTLRSVGAFLATALVLPLPGSCQSSNNNSSSPLQLTFGSQGLQTLSYNGTMLADLGAHSGDNFYIGHMKATDLSGNTLPGGQYGWGENNNGKQWNAATQTWSYSFNWGSITVQYVQSGTNLNLVTTISNNASSGIIFDGAAIFPAVLHFPQLPANFGAANYPQMAFNTTGPSVTPADWGGGEVIAVAPDASKPLYSGFWPAQSSGGVPYAPEISGTTPDGLATFQPHNDRPVAPGQTDQYTVSLRFAPSGTSTASLAADAYSSWTAHYPPVLNWSDRRPIGTVYLASSPQSGNVNQPGGFPTNPRRYFNTSSVDITSAAGLASFQQQLLSKAAEVVTNSQQLGAQGVVTWDIEGEQYPQATSYVCEPDLIAQVAPEMESTVNVPGSPFNGQKLDDAYFATLHNAGLRVGVCLRPQHFTLNADGTASQVYLPQDSIFAELQRKAKYAHDRWGATLFYVDSTVDTTGAVLPAAIFQQLQATLPDSLFIPEETTPLDYAYTAPFKSFIDLGALGTDPIVLQYYPHAFSAVLVNDADAGKLAAAQTQLIAQVRQGDVLMAHVDYWQANNPVIAAIYKAAGVVAAGSTSTASSSSSASTAASSTTTTSSDSSSSTSASSTAAPSATSSSDSSTSNSATSSAPASSDAAPTTTSSSDSSTSTAATTSTPASSTSTVAPSTSASSTATAASATSSAKISISWPGAGQILSGLIAIQGVINDTLDAAGSHLVVDGYDLLNTRLTNAPYTYALDTSTLPNGMHVLQLWGHDINNEVILSATISVQVQN